MSALGLRTSIVGAANVRGTVGGPDGPDLRLLGHADTVPGEPTASCAVDEERHSAGAR
ncbi:hypothetical protein [Streptomyces olivochromogenes]|uniref:hypothetical protein n=1 Tax=Streptomyces olivochromogenes TaxID=1963 RepID=UPI0036BB7AEF